MAHLKVNDAYKVLRLPAYIFIILILSCCNGSLFCGGLSGDILLSACLSVSASI